MFTGIVEEIGVVDKLQRGRFSAVLTIKARVVLEGLKAVSYTHLIGRTSRPAQIL